MHLINKDLQGYGIFWSVIKHLNRNMFQRNICFYKIIQAYRLILLCTYHIPCTVRQANHIWTLFLYSFLFILISLLQFELIQYVCIVTLSATLLKTLIPKKCQSDISLLQFFYAKNAIFLLNQIRYHASFEERYEAMIIVAFKL